MVSSELWWLLPLYQLHMLKGKYYLSVPFVNCSLCFIIV